MLPCSFIYLLTFFLGGATSSINYWNQVLKYPHIFENVSVFPFSLVNFDYLLSGKEPCRLSCLPGELRLVSLCNFPFWHSVLFVIKSTVSFIRVKSFFFFFYVFCLHGLFFLHFTCNLSGSLREKCISHRL